MSEQTLSSAFPSPLDLPQGRDRLRSPVAPTRGMSLVLSALALGALLRALLAGEGTLGLGSSLAAFALIGTLVRLGGPALSTRAGPARLLLLPILALSAMPTVRASPALIALDLSAALFLVLVYCAAAAGLLRSPRPHLPLVTVPLAGLRDALARPPLLLRALDQLPGLRERARPLILPLLRGFVFSVPVLLLFGALLGAADPSFAELLSSARAFFFASESGLVRSLAWTLGLAWLIAGLFALALGEGALAPKRTESPREGRLAAVESLVLLSSLIVLFWLFCALQLAHLFGSLALVPGSGVTLSQSARSGFFELVWVASLVLLLLILLRAETRLSLPRERHAFAALGSALIVLSLGICASALHRMALYRDAYGSTFLRLWSHDFIWLIGALLVLCALSLWWRPERFMAHGLVTGIAALFLFNASNPDARIARDNLRPATTAVAVPIDVGYLANLSADAVPEIWSVLDALDAKQGQPLVAAIRLSLGSDESWRSWNLSRTIARGLLEGCADPRPAAGGRAP